MRNLLSLAAMVLVLPCMEEELQYFRVVVVVYLQRVGSVCGWAYRV